MLKYRNLIFVACLATALLSPLGKAVAMPAYPKPITVTQPDGMMVTVCLRGDERLNWAQTTDGYTLLRNEDGYWTFARRTDTAIWWLPPSCMTIRPFWRGSMASSLT